MKFAVDLVTFYHPGFWGVESYEAVAAIAAADPRAFWTKLLDSVADAGVTGIELTFPPFDWRSAVAAFGSVDGVAAALSARGLVVASGFVVDLDRAPDLAGSAAQAHIVAETEAYARFVKACGGDVLVIGLPCRQTFNEQPPRFVDLASMGPVADLLNRMGAATARIGVRCALHTEAHSVFCAPRDVDLLMLLTDPRYVFFCPDPAHIILEGGDPLVVARRHAERIVIAHWKDATGPMPREVVIDHGIYDRHKPYFCPMGDGRVDWPAWATLMGAVTDAWSVLELDAAADPVAAIRDGRAFAQSMVSA
jgi:sugar phosphate isomerase/epimerase